jgi:hypothetical protein
MGRCQHHRWRARRPLDHRHGTDYTVTGPATLNSIVGLTNIGATLSAFQGVDTLNRPFGVMNFDAAVFSVAHGPFSNGAFSDAKSVGFIGDETYSISDRSTSRARGVRFGG